MEMLLLNIIPFAHQVLQNHLPEGGVALDGTAGNGHDTVFLAQCVGEQGQVWAFDVQKQAIEQTRARLQQANLLQRVHLIQDGHQHLNHYLQEHHLDAAVFNFGWLPGGDKSCTTHAQSSIQALEAVVGRLNPHAVVVAVLYPGHEAGQIEATAIEQWAKKLPQQTFAVLQYGFINRQNRPPYLLVIQKLP